MSETAGNPSCTSIGVLNLYLCREAIAKVRLAQSSLPSGLIESRARRSALTQILPRLAAVLAIFLSLGSSRAAAQSVALSRNHPVDVAQLAETRRAAPYRELDLKIVMALRNEAALDKLLADQQDPASPQYHHWLTPAEFSARFDPDPKDLAAIARWLTAEGFTVTSSSVADRFVGFAGPVAAAERVFGVTIVATADDLAYGNLDDPVVPARLAKLITHVDGLDNLRHYLPLIREDRSRRKLRLVKRAQPLTSASFVEGSVSGKPFSNLQSDYVVDGFPPAFAPNDAYTFYDEGPVLSANINGKGSDCIALIEDSDYAIDAVNIFDDTFLPNAPPLDISDAFDTSDPGRNGDEGEALLDIQWSHAVAPGAALRVYIGDDNDYIFDPITDGIKKAVKENKCSAISISFAACGAPASFYTGIQEPIYKQAASQGQSIFVSAGDDGAAGLVVDRLGQVCVPGESRNVNEMSANPYATSVGGTQFNPEYDSSGNDVGFVPEGVWDEPASVEGAGGGGLSAVFSKPAYQRKVTPADDKRDVPDVAMMASPDQPGVFVGDDPSDPGSLCPPDTACIECCIGGTSLAAPMWAGISRLIAQSAGDRLGNINPRIYQLGPLENTSPVGLRDVTIGSNDFNKVIGFVAGPLYDRASGWGTADIAQLVSAFPSPALSLSASSIKFPAVGIDTGSSKRTFKITNSGEGVLTGSLDLSKLQAPFATADGASTSFSLARNKSIAVSLLFTPTSAGESNGSIIVDTTNATGNSSSVVTVSGTGAPGLLSVASALKFGTVRVNGSKKMTLSIRNTGAGVLHVTLDTSGLAAPFSSTIASGEYAVSPGRGLADKVMFAPTSAQAMPFTGQIAISSDDPKRPSANVNVSGSAK